MRNSDSATDYCDYCRLPVALPRGQVAAADAAHEPLYCCLGCRVAATISGPTEADEHAHWNLLKVGFAIFFSMNVMVYTLVLWSSDIYTESTGGREALLYDLYRYVCLLFTMPVLMLLGSPLLEAAWSDVRSKRISSSLLLATGVAAAFAFSLFSVLRGRGQVYFEIVCMVLVAVTIGRWLEAAGKRQTAELLRGLEKLLPDTVRVIRAGSEELVPLAQVEIGDLVRVLPGERIAVDGRIVRNLGAIDEQTVTGESTPAVKEPGDDVFSGTLNLDGDLMIEATARASSGTLERIVSSLLEAAAKKDRYGRLADRVSALFVPTVLCVILFTLSIHFYRGQVERAWLSALAVALIACPCALALATPLAVWTSLGRAAREQVLLQNSDSLVQLARARTICFDKTGTITTGHSSLAYVVTDEITPRETLLNVAAAISQVSLHPLAVMVHELSTMTMPGLEVIRSKALPGRGIEAELRDAEGQTLQPCLGSIRMMQEFKLAMPPHLALAIDQALDEGGTIVCLGWEGMVRGLFVAGEVLRTDAKSALDALRQQGLRLVMLTGDHARRAERLAEELSLEAYGELLPDDKVAMIKKLKATSGPVVMVGDGINDAPALAAADVGVALGCGTDVSRHTADLCLLGNQLERIPWMVALARETTRTIRWNLVWALAYNSLGVAIAAAGWLNPIIAAAAMVISSLFVVSNSLRLSHWLPEHTQVTAATSAVPVEAAAQTIPARFVS